MSTNRDNDVIKDFGAEWSKYNQSTVSEPEITHMFERYFSVFPWDRLPSGAVGFDLGSGSGRWAKLVAPRVGKLYCIDASVDTLNVARRNVQSENAEFICASVDEIPLEDNSMDFGYSLGVLHHVPDTQAGIISCVNKLKPGAPFLLYLYYAFDNRPAWFRAIWKCSDIARKIICRLPIFIKTFVSMVLAVIIYWPLARFARFMEKHGRDVSDYPLCAYRNLSFYTMRTDSHDRFCTRLEQRFTKVQIQEMMEKAGLQDIVFAGDSFWTAVGFKKKLEFSSGGRNKCVE